MKKIKVYGLNRLERWFGISNRHAELLLTVSMTILVVHWFVILWFVLARLGSLNFLRLHYSAAFGIDWVDSWWKIFIFPLGGLVVWLVNGLFAGFFSRNSRLLSLVLHGTTIFLEILFAIGGLMAVLLNA